ncbi:cyclic AMP-dependent transcription factor ATF-6 beta-like isoform X2 [Haliotis cracherodii]|uniref:cyclic AMP-dependent transcription factor ATF-6 beta-like isoform X2 n=1 Tax=Haliotis cracherodii TaxID=6455 RepID=UPI0039E81E98
MSVDFVSEVDRRFFANNMLTNEDWESGMDQFNDISEILGMDTTISPENLSELPDELLSLEGSSSPVDLSTNSKTLPMEDFNFEHKFDDEKLDFSKFTDENFDDYWKEQSDSSDSGIYGETVHIKQEPPSPVSSNCSETGSEGYSSLSSSANAFVFASPPATSEDCKPTIIINTAGNTLLPNLQPNVVNINSILNSKIKIQPKPSEGGTTLAQPKSQAQSVPAKPLVLTGEEFAKLTAAGTLRFQPPGEVKGIAVPPKQPQQQQQQTVVTTVQPCMSPPPGMIQVDGEGKALKRQQRMIKNRESASLSRKRKKEYLTGLESRLKGFSTENQKLKQENETLKRKMSALQMENDKLKKAFSLSPNKRMCLLTVLVVFSFNIGPISNFFSSHTIPVPNPSVVNVHRGRQLLSLQEEEELSFKENINPRWKHAGDNMFRKLQQLSDEMGWTHPSGKMNQSDFEALMCPTFFNKTESIRLAEQLAGWMIQHEEEKMKSEASKRQKKKRKEIRPVKTLKRALRGDFNPNMLRSKDSGYHVQVFDGSDGRKEFLDAIHRRNDTFYVLSFNTDYLLVPASAHNKTMRPRMSLVMPVVTINETMQPPPGSVGMMQIDCEVLGTQLIHVHKSVIPPPSPVWNATHNAGYSGDTGRDQR